MTKHLWSFRKGWENENLARFLLSRFSFVAHPSSVSDDVGTDFYCTIFDIIRERGTKYLRPRSSFAIQIKSNYRVFSATSKIEYLKRLELPYFVGIVDNRKKSLAVHTGEFIPILLNYKEITQLKIRLVKATYLSQNKCYHEKDGTLTMIFPKLVEFRADDTQDELTEKTTKMLSVCLMMLKNISKVNNNQFLFRLRGELAGIENSFPVTTVAGKGSANAYTQNMLDMLTEVFHNLLWIYGNSRDTFNLAEFRAYEGLLKSLSSAGIQIPSYVTEKYEILATHLKAKHSLRLPSGGTSDWR
jgi:hypothetical protein